MTSYRPKVCLYIPYYFSQQSLSLCCHEFVNTESLEMGNFSILPSINTHKNLCLTTMRGKSPLNQKPHERRYTKHETTLAHYSDAIVSVLFPGVEFLAIVKCRMTSNILLRSNFSLKCTVPSQL